MQNETHYIKLGFKADQIDQFEKSVSELTAKLKWAYSSTIEYFGPNAPNRFIEADSARPSADAILLHTLEIVRFFDRCAKTGVQDAVIYYRSSREEYRFRSWNAVLAIWSKYGSTIETAFCDWLFKEPSTYQLVELIAKKTSERVLVSDLLHMKPFVQKHEHTLILLQGATSDHLRWLSDSPDHLNDANTASKHFGFGLFNKGFENSGFENGEPGWLGNAAGPTRSLLADTIVDQILERAPLISPQKRTVIVPFEVDRLDGFFDIIQKFSKASWHITHLIIDTEKTDFATLSEEELPDWTALLATEIDAIEGDLNQLATVVSERCLTVVKDQLKDHEVAKLDTIDMDAVRAAVQESMRKNAAKQFEIAKNQIGARLTKELSTSFSSADERPLKQYFDEALRPLFTFFGLGSSMLKIAAPTFLHNILHKVKGDADKTTVASLNIFKR